MASSLSSTIQLVFSPTDHATILSIVLSATVCAWHAASSLTLIDFAACSIHSIGSASCFLLYISVPLIAGSTNSIYHHFL